MLLKILKLLGIDLPARMAEVRIDVEERFELAKAGVEHAARTAAVSGLLFFLAGLAALWAFGVGLIALYSWVSSKYGEFYGLAVIGGVLVFVAISMFASAVNKAKSWRDENASYFAAKKRDRAEIHAERVAAQEAVRGPASRPLPRPPLSSQTTAASDLTEALASTLSNTIKLPATGNPVFDEIFARLQSNARGSADETVEGLIRAVRYGDRAQMFTVLGGATLLGWLMAANFRTANRDPGTVAGSMINPLQGERPADL